MKQCFSCLGNLVKNGFSKTKKQQFYCKPCKKSFTEGKDEKILKKQHILEEMSQMKSLREIAKEHHVSPATILTWLKRINNQVLHFSNEKKIKVSEVENFIKNHKPQAKSGILVLGEEVFVLEIEP